jgi:6-phosphogluconolactonase (cycloisomerase 2 family)
VRDLLYIGGYGGCIVSVRRDPRTGRLTPSGDVARTENPSFLAAHPRLPIIYAVGELEEGEITVWDAGLRPKQRASSGGAQPCHVNVVDDLLVTTNYGGGNVAVHHLSPYGRIGALETMLTGHTHPHQSTVDGEELLVTDLGQDLIYRYGAAETVAAPGGPRHMIRIDDYAYVLGENDATLTIFDVPAWSVVRKVATSKAGGRVYPSELVAADGRLYIGNRGPDTIAVFTLDGTYETEVPSGGAWPRHLCLDVGPGTDFLHVSNQHSHTVATFRSTLDGLEQVAELSTPSPACVILAPWTSR